MRLFSLVFIDLGAQRGNAETAEVLGISADSASKRYFRALKRLREIMQASGIS